MESKGTHNKSQDGATPYYVTYITSDVDPPSVNWLGAG